MTFAETSNLHLMLNIQKILKACQKQKSLSLTLLDEEIKNEDYIPIYEFQHMTSFSDSWSS